MMLVSLFYDLKLNKLEEMEELINLKKKKLYGGRLKEDIKPKKGGII